MPITVTPEEKAELKSAGSLLRPLAGAEGAASMTFHNPKTGQEFFGLPIDPYHLGRHLRRGLVMGPAYPELKAKWEAGEAERQAANDALMAEHLAKAPPPIEESPRFAEAVAAAVIIAVERLNEKQEAHPQKEEATVDPEGVQLAMFVPIDAPSESETKHEVSPASRPYLRVVD